MKIKAPKVPLFSDQIMPEMICFNNQTLDSPDLESYKTSFLISVYRCMLLLHMRFAISTLFLH